MQKIKHSYSISTFSLLAILQIVFFILKVTSTVTWSWWIIFIPGILFILGGIGVIVFMFVIMWFMSKP